MNYCNNCYYLKRIHPMQKHQNGGMKAICMFTDGYVGEDFVRCEEFKKFIGFAYRKTEQVFSC